MHCENYVCQHDCVATCDDKECGDDGCNGSCGTCDQGKSCTQGKCLDLVPDCGSCSLNADCASGNCRTHPQFGAVGSFCFPATKCTEDTQCPSGWRNCDVQKNLCLPNARWTCSGRFPIITDSCEHILKVGRECAWPQECITGVANCVDVPRAALCQTCSVGEDCQSGLCASYQNFASVGSFCAPSGTCSNNAQCPDSWRCDTTTQRCWTTPELTCSYNNRVIRDNCWHLLETAPCMSPSMCQEGTCVTSCVRNCSGRVCGSDGCGGSCGACPVGYYCGYDGVCYCQSQCTSTRCDESDGCGGRCGYCPVGWTCSSGYGYCECWPYCPPNAPCDLPDGCGGVCNECPYPETCGPDGICCVGC